jgi:hypothetical protein
VRTFLEEELKPRVRLIMCTGDGTHAIREMRFAAANKTPYDLLLLDHHVRNPFFRFLRFYYYYYYTLFYFISSLPC